ncbi:lysine--tRNA ligase [bacterium G20]|nr:lysine--tRNA ligase [bacterium G20]
MQWLNKVADEVSAARPEGELIVSSGVSPSGKYHIGTLREVLTADAIMLALKKRGRTVRHIHFVDDLDGLRKVPAGVPAEFEKYLGIPVCDVPAPDGSQQSYADYYLADFVSNIGRLGIDMQLERSHQKYRAGYFVPSIEKALANIDAARQILEEISGRSLGEEWSPIQVNEDGYLKKRPFVKLDTQAKTVRYLDKDDKEKEISYGSGEVKLDWRLDWPARWWQLGVDVEPFGRDHAAKGGSYDTGAQLVKKIFDGKAPIPVPYEFINRAGETKKMSKSAGNTVSISELLEVLPPEIVRYFVLRFPPDKELFFDQQNGVVRLIDEYAELLAKPDKTEEEKLLLEISAGPLKENTISNVPFSHLVASYQASLRDEQKTLDVISRTEHADVAGQQAGVIKKELGYISSWLDKWAPEDVKFALREQINGSEFTDAQKKFLQALGQKVATAPAGADGEWFHKAIYNLKDEVGMEPKAMFEALYKVLIGKTSGPRAGWFLSILPRDWLIKRLQLET